MKTTALLRVASLVTLTLALSTQGQAQTPPRTRIGGEVDDYTALADPAGPWHITGEWTLRLKGESGKGNFSLALSMVRSQNPAPAAHTHHVMVVDGDVTPVANGFQISGTAVITSNGNVAGFSGSPVDMQVTGGNGLPYSNVAVTFGGAAAAHFGDQPIHGVVTSRR
jgi:hypothetical protein